MQRKWSRSCLDEALHVFLRLDLVECTTLMPPLQPTAYFSLLELNADLSIDERISRVKTSKGTLFHRERVPSVTIYRRVSLCRGIATIRLSFANETRTPRD